MCKKKLLRVISYRCIYTDLFTLKRFYVKLIERAY